MFPESSIQEMMPASQITEEVEVNLDEVITVEDASRDFNEIQAPPPANIYPIKLMLNEKKGGGNIKGVEIPKGIEVKVDKNKKTFVGVHLIGKLQATNEAYDGYEIYNIYVNTILFSGKVTSELHSLLTKLGENVPNSMPALQIVQLCEKVFSEQPIQMAELEWEASYKKNDGSGQYEKQCRNMKSFPRNPDGTYNHVVTSELDGEPLYARAVIKKFVSQ
jgi:hypothetical protein